MAKVSVIVKLQDTSEFPVRLAFAQHLFTAGTVGGEGKPAFSVTAILPPNHPVLAELAEAEEKCAVGEWGEKAGANLKAIRAAGKGVIKDGDMKANYDGFAGNKFVSCRSKEEARPNVFNRDGSQISERDGIVYSGCYSHVIISVWAQDSEYGKRINAQVTGVKFNRDGDSFGGGTKGASPDDFADLSTAEDDGDSMLD